MAIDMHAHWVPRRLMSESKAGRDWYGWRILQDGAGREYASLGQHMLLFSASQGTLDDPMDRAKRREAEDGITFEALMLTGLFWNYHLPEDAAVRACREVNEEVAEVQRAYPDRFCGMALLPMQHQKAALAELEYASGKLNLRTIAIASNVRNLNLDEPSVLPVIEAAAKMGLSICVHPTIWDKAADARLPRYSFANSFGAPLEFEHRGDVAGLQRVVRPSSGRASHVHSGGRLDPFRGREARSTLSYPSRWPSHEAQAGRVFAPDVLRLPRS